MKNIKANVKELLEILTQNRDLHHDIFIAAQKIYRSEVIRRLDKALQDAKDGKEFPGSIHIPAPEDHTKDYDRVIRMLQLSVDENIELDERDVEVYVLDRWSWSHNWAASNFQYLNDSAVSSYAVTGSMSTQATYQSLFGGTGAISASWSSGSCLSADGALKTMQAKLSSYL
jgi:hypothetical protein